MREFVGRKRELETLERYYSSSGNRCCAIYGRRRIGKTALVSRFVEDKKHFWFTASDTGLSDNISRFGHEVRKVMSEDPPEDVFGIFSALERMIDSGPLVIVMDEFPDLVSASPIVASLMQEFIDRRLQRTESYLIVLGSSISAMKSEILDERKPLFGRFGCLMELKPLPYTDCRKLVPDMSDEDAMSLFCIFGGIPLYYISVTGRTFHECLVLDLLNADSLFGTEADAVILRELTPISPYKSILSAISRGATTQNEIVGRTGIPQSTISGYLSRLEIIGLVSADKPVFGGSRRPVYRISDRLLDWHFSVLGRYGASARTEDLEALAESLKEEISAFLGRGFEHACREYVARRFTCLELGSWWGRADGEDTDIDVAAIARIDGSKTAIMGECKFRNKETTYATLESLRKRASAVGTPLSIHLMLFSRSGFSESLMDAEEDGQVELIGLDRMLSIDER